MKKMLTLIALFAAICLAFGACAESERPADARTPYCRNEAHWDGDGLDHYRPQSCWTTGHFNCDGMNHEKAPCKLHRHYNCDGREHLSASCGAPGHFTCDRKEHAPAACGIAGHCVSDDLKHTLASCGLHYRCEGGKHGAASCGIEGHTVCDGLTHERAVCGKARHYACDGLTHETAACGLARHCVSDGLDHTPAACGTEGHYNCDERKHVPAACGIAGHYACEPGRHTGKVISGYCNAVPKHVVCEGNPEHYCDPAYGGCGKTYACSRSNAHTACRMCGLLWCDRSLGAHKTPCDVPEHRPCVYTLNGKEYNIEEHSTTCELCGDLKCAREAHGLGVCVSICEACGGPELYGYNHFNVDCEHYWCTTPGPHGVWCNACEAYVCEPACVHVATDELVFYYAPEAAELKLKTLKPLPAQPVSVYDLLRMKEDPSLPMYPLRYPVQ